MYLNEQEKRIFYRIWLGLLDYTNQKHQINPKLEFMNNSKAIKPVDVAPVRNKLWENDTIINEYVMKNPMQLAPEELEILYSWKTRVAGTFIIVKHLKKYTVFYHMVEGGQLYGVLGISDPLSDMFDSSQLPIYVEAILIPFAGKIIYDSLICPYGIHFGGNMRKSLSNEYRSRKEKSGIITSFSIGEMQK
jgi:hypothetical protein